MSLLWLRFALACYFIGLIYAFFALTRTSELFRRIALHAASLGIEHPTNGQRMVWQSPLPKELEKLVRRWRRG